MSGWDFDFDQDESFAAGFNEPDQILFSENPVMESSVFLQPEAFQMNSLNVRPIQQTKPVRNFPAPSGQDLAQENDQLRQFFSSLKEQAERAESINQSLKSQLEDCRNWFRDAMFTGITNHK